MQSEEIRKKFLEFFEKRGHVLIPSASLVTTDEAGAMDATLFNTAGMQPFVPYLLGEPHPKGERLVNVQKCLRTIDLSEVGDNTHNTFFEMMGNWSLGDYFKKEAITWSYEFLTSKTEGLGLDVSRLYVTVFAGNEKIKADTESVEIWKSLGIPEHRIYYKNSKSNWW
ncbi:MAG: alanine--tRNA ligase-related protein, partial [Candidatus Paceibacterota bacterium]